MATLNGDSTNNVLAGTGTSDSISGGGGDDTILAGGGNDTVSGGSGNDYIDGGSGNDDLSGGSGDDTILAGSGNDTVSGGSGSDYIDGGAGNDFIDGGSGNDLLFGGAGKDLIYGGSGSDWIDGGTGNDLLFGGSGNDTILGGDGDDTIKGGSGDDAIYGQSGNDVLLGGSGNDYVDGGPGRDIIVGGSGHDVLLGNSGDDVMDGSGGDDVLAGGAGNDALFGGSGNDTLIGGAGVDYLHGGSGNDRFVFEDASDSPAAGSWDRISDFTQGKDKIDLSAFLGSANLAWGGKSSMAYGVSYAKSDSITTVSADVTGDGVADFKVELKNTRWVELSADDFIGVGVNGRPEAGNGSAAGDEDTSISGNVSATDPDSDALTFSVVDGPANGNVVLNGDGSFTYKPNANFNGSDQFTYKVNDGSSDSNVATVSLTVNSVNDAPVAQNANGVGNEDAPYHSWVSASDVDGDALTYSLVAPVDGVTLNADGSYTVNPLASDQGLDDGESREVTFQYVARDGSLESAPATVKVTINGSNDAPVAQAVSDTTDEDSVLNGTLAATDIDGENLSFSLVAPVNGLTVHPSGTFHFDPRGLFDSLGVGASTDVTFQYVANDGTVDSAPATATIRVTGANDAPEANADSANAVGLWNDFLSDASGYALSNDRDPDQGDSLTVSAINGDPDAMGNNVDGKHGFLIMGDDGSWNYFLKGALAAGSSDTDVFHYTVTDQHGATSSSTLTFNVTGADVAPVVTNVTNTVSSIVTDAGGDTSSTGSQTDSSTTPAPISLPASANDNVITGVSAGDQVDIPVWALLANDANVNGNPVGIVSLGGTSNGDMVSFSGGNIAFTDADEFAASSFTYVANYGSSSGNPVTVNVSQDVDGVIDGTAGNDILIGARYESATFVGNEGDDIMFGGHYSDTFDFNALTDRGTTGDVIVGFQKGLDNLDLHDLMATLNGYDGSNAFSGGYLQFAQSGNDTLVLVDGNGGGDSFETLATVVGVHLDSTDTGDFIL